MQKLTHLADDSIFNLKYVYRQAAFIFIFHDIFFEKFWKSAFECKRTHYAVSANKFMKQNYITKSLSGVFLTTISHSPFHGKLIFSKIMEHQNLINFVCMLYSEWHAAKHSAHLPCYRSVNHRADPAPIQHCSV